MKGDIYDYDTCIDYGCGCGHKIITQEDRVAQAKLNKILEDAHMKPITHPICKNASLRHAKIAVDRKNAEKAEVPFRPPLAKRSYSRTVAGTYLGRISPGLVDTLVKAGLLKLVDTNKKDKESKITALSVKILAGYMLEDNEILKRCLSEVAYASLMKPSHLKRVAQYVAEGALD